MQQPQESELKGDLVEGGNLRGDLVEKNSLEGESQADASRNKGDISDTHEPEL